MRDSRGLTIVELLIAMVIIGVAFAALAMSQLGSLKASANSQLVTEAKAAANRVLETRMNAVLKVEETTSTNPYKDDCDEDAGTCRSFYFIDHFYSCPTVVSSTPPDIRDDLRAVDCSGTVTENNVEVDWGIRRGSGTRGEGVLTVVVTAEHTKGGATITLGDRITCYDVYPSPTASAPAPCPKPAGSGS